MNDFKRRCVELRKKDYTLPEIVKITGRPKTSVYFHIQNISLSPTKRNAIREASIKRALEVSKSRKGKSKRKFREFNSWSNEMVLLVAHLLFDGEIRYTVCGYSNRSILLVKRVEKLMRKVYNFDPSRRNNPQTGVSNLSYHNVALAAYFKKKSKELLAEIRNFPIGFKLEFLRAFFDDEGCMDFRPKDSTRRVRGYQKNTTILHLVQELLANFGIESHVKKPNEVVIIGKENLKKFHKEINFSKGVRVNGNRSNSVWKKSLEKREILKMAIDSYR